MTSSACALLTVLEIRWMRAVEREPMTVTGRESGTPGLP